MNKPDALNGKVLLVDDDPFVLREYGKLLERMGLQVSFATDGQLALECFGRQPIDVVVTDLAMPTMGGLHFLRELRKINVDVPVILITGSPDVQTAVAALEYGAFHYLTKPVSPDKFKGTLSRALAFRALDRLHRAGDENGSKPGMPAFAALEARFEAALSNLWIAFQPIVSWSRKGAFAYEALVRSTEPSMNNPGLLFDAADQLGRMLHLGRAIRAKVADTISRHPDKRFFVNLNPIELNDDELHSSGCPLAPFANQIVFEVTERTALASVSGVTAQIERLRKNGYQIAVDDLGAGYASLSSFIHIEPDFVKVDLSLVRDLHLSPRKRTLIRGINQICVKDLGISVICEGVEKAEERDVLLAEGIDFLQGYYFARPSPALEIVNFQQGTPETPEPDKADQSSRRAS
ncbi:MAG TPA: EAL domain-containing protein [Polyangiaceae bacterium]|jgi:EAL domain-containing protein (putative c-di-GMP-specific phosphodiesterase class I)|nr:EAL domain-containing protein [Polyangiaceae bacterium]